MVARNPVLDHSPAFACGARTAFVKSFGRYEDCDALELLCRATDGLLQSLELDWQHLDLLVTGSVIPQVKSINLAREAVQLLRLPYGLEAYTINGACASGLQAVIEGVKAIALGRSQVVLASGTECASDVPIIYSKEAQRFLLKFAKSRSAAGKLNIIKNFNARAWLPKPTSRAESLIRLTLGEECEQVARSNRVSRSRQDRYACESHRRAHLAEERGFFAREIIPFWPPTRYESCVTRDDIIAGDTTLERLASQRPLLDLRYGSLTAGNSTLLTDGAAVGLLGAAQRLRDLGLTPTLEIVDFDASGIPPSEQLLHGPALSIVRLLERNGLTLADIDRFEIHESFACQVIGCLESLASKGFHDRKLSSSKLCAEIPAEKVNANGGALALGHPLGATGVRLLLTMAGELQASDLNQGVIAICGAGGSCSSLLVRRLG